MSYYGSVTIRKAEILTKDGAKTILQALRKKQEQGPLSNLALMISSTEEKSRSVTGEVLSKTLAKTSIERKSFKEPKVEAIYSDAQSTQLESVRITLPKTNIKSMRKAVKIGLSALMDVTITGFSAAGGIFILTTGNIPIGASVLACSAFFFLDAIKKRIDQSKVNSIPPEVANAIETGLSFALSKFQQQAEKKS